MLTKKNFDNKNLFLNHAGKSIHVVGVIIIGFWLSNIFIDNLFLFEHKESLFKNEILQ